MGIALDTPGFAVTNPGATLTAATPASGDSASVRVFAAGSQAHLENIIRGGTATGEVAVRSPLMYDNTFGIRVGSSISPQKWTIPHEQGQILNSGDFLGVLLTGGTAEVDIAALTVYYDNLPGASARLHAWGDIAGSIMAFKTVKVALTTSATVGVWVDTAITVTENDLKAGMDHALLGIVTDTAVDVIGLKGAETNNFRICQPGYIAVEDTSDYFVRWSNDNGRPHIPVFNSTNAPNIFVSTLHHTASLALNAYLFLAALQPNLTS